MKKLNYIFLLILSSTLAFTGCGLLDLSPAAVQNVVATADETGSITVTWDELEEAQGYVPKVSEQDDPAGSGWDSFIDRNIYPDGTTDTTATFTEGTPGTTYYFIVEYFAEGEDTYAETEPEKMVVASAVFPELNPGVSAIDYIGFTDSLPSNDEFTGSYVDFAIQGDASAIDHFTMTYSLEGQTADAYNWPSADATFTLSDVTEQSDGSYRIDGISFPDTYHAEIDGATGFYTAEGRRFSCSVKAFDASGNELESASDGKIIEVYDEIRLATDDYDNTADTLDVYFYASSGVTDVRFLLYDSDDNLLDDSTEYGINQPEVHEAAQSDLRGSLKTSSVYKVEFTTGNLSKGWYYIVVVPSDDGTNFDTSASSSTPEFYVLD